MSRSILDELVDDSRLSGWIFICPTSDDKEVYIGPFTSAAQAFEWADAMKMHGTPVPITDPFSSKDLLKRNLFGID